MPDHVPYSVFVSLFVPAADKTASFSVGDKVALAEGSLRGRLVSAETHAGVRTVPDDKPNTSPTEADPINGGNKIESFVTYSCGVDSWWEYCYKTVKALVHLNHIFDDT